MSKPRELWWSYVKNVLRKYPNVPEREAVDAAVEEFTDRPDVLALIGLVYLRKTHDLTGAAAACHVSYGAAKEWHGNFVHCVAHHMGLPMSTEIRQR